ncbi:MAG: cysteine synthase A [Erysipelotrichaceae bacterium]|nr:cysteine synthase A [Erysipelotrichaceae bacterium]MDY5252231.1 cysteine synthase A [Erysipelotrichaceae bacterium]
MKVYANILETVGNTPIVRCQKLAEKYHLSSHIYAKIEAFNPGGSVKDRVAKNMILQAMKEGKIQQDTVLIEPTSGNTGIGLAWVAALLRLPLIIVMPSSMSVERRKLIKAYGAKIVLTDAKLGMAGAIAKANELMKEYPNSFMPSQFSNLDNPSVHYQTTGPEIYADMDGKIDYLVCGVGTGGTISGSGRYLKEKLPNIQIVAVEPASSPFLSRQEKGPHAIQGIGAGFAPDTLDQNIYDQIITITDQQAMDTARQLAMEEGILAGISSGAAMAAAIELASNNKDANIVVVLPDTGERYLSTSLFGEE